ncbi:hypothetical protein [Aquisphaera insulae]|uniref:hypothetical protein n=1 Tax=Aquisphaera insulae TaxID=2712864 RepID=UPI0013E9DB4D|nr:hypothetical protein [Aquisphaera insulae]
MADPSGGAQSSGIAGPELVPGSGVRDCRVRSLSLRKRVGFGLLCLVLLALIGEGGGFFLFWILNGRPNPWRDAQERRQQRILSPRGNDPGTFAQVHPYVGYVEEPGGESGVRRLVDGHSIPITDYGYIDDKSPLQRRGDDRVIVGITGGSVASFFAVNGIKSLEESLSSDPRHAGKRFVFLNLALGGYKQPQQLMTLNYLLCLGAEFDLVINIDGFNEVALYELENKSHHVFPAFPRGWHSRIGVNDPVLGRARARLLTIEEQRSDLARWYSGFPWRYSLLFNLAWEYRDRRLGWEAYRILEGYSRSSESRGPYVVTGPPVDFATPEALFEHLAMIWANSSSLMNQLCRGRGIGYFHFLQPNQYLPDSKPMGRAERETAIIPDHPYRRGVEMGYPLLIRRGRTLAEAGVSFHDLTGIFSDHPGAIYADSCCHYNQAGYDLMARAIARAILAAGHP